MTRIKKYKIMIAKSFKTALPWDNESIIGRCYWLKGYFYALRIKGIITTREEITLSRLLDSVLDYYG